VKEGTSSKPFIQRRVPSYDQNGFIPVYNDVYLQSTSNDVGSPSNLPEGIG